MTAPGPLRIAVVGDVLADTDIVGDAERLSPEAPVPVVDEHDERHRAGGAGLAATLAARDGAAVTLVGAFADDDAGRRLRGLLAARGVEVVALPWSGSTVEKIRIRAGDVPMLRLDRGQGHLPPSLGPSIRHAAAAIGEADAVLVADYGRGVAAAGAVREAVAVARRGGVPVVWDPHPRGPAPVPGASLVCPNDKEAAAVASGPHDPSGLAGVIAHARMLRDLWECGAVAVTMGQQGALVVLGDGAPLTVPVLDPSAAGDTCGAGDAFAAAATLALASGAVMSEAVQSAVDAAARFVALGGAAGLAGAPTAPPVPPTPAPPSRGAGTLVATGGCFDILHPGHVHTLRAARRLGDRLVVLVNDDASVRRLKGPDRPLQPVEDRCAVLASLADIDDVVVFSEDTPVEALRRLRPAIFVKGGDYTAADLPETAVLAEWGGSVVTVPFIEGRSTTQLVHRARTRR